MSDVLHAGWSMDMFRVRWTPDLFNTEWMPGIFYIEWMPDMFYIEWMPDMMPDMVQIGLMSSILRYEGRPTCYWNAQYTFQVGQMLDIVHHIRHSIFIQRVRSSKRETPPPRLRISEAG